VIVFLANKAMCEFFFHDFSPADLRTDKRLVQHSRGGFHLRALVAIGLLTLEPIFYEQHYSLHSNPLKIAKSC